MLRTMYPTPAYEIPDDVFFEVTGMLQVVPVAVAAYYLWRLLGERKAPSRHPAPP